MKILIASNNKHKIKEFKRMFSKYSNIEIVSLPDLNDHDEVVEDGTTFSENAFIKAKYYYDKYQMYTLSDDSGICVPALNGAPGVYSARYSGLGDEENNKLLLKNLESCKDRSAYYEADICFYNGIEPKFFIGKCYGEIGFEEVGSEGFGYDPLFIFKDGKTFAQMSMDEKNQYSHRALALKDFYKYFKDTYLK